MKRLAEEREAARSKQNLEAYAGGSDDQLRPAFEAELERQERLRRWQRIESRR